MPTDISHYPDAAAVLGEFLDAKIPLTQDDLERCLHRMESQILGDHLDALRRIGMLRKLQGDDEPYVLTSAAMESADLFGETWWKEGEAFWKRWKKTEERLARRPLWIASAAGLGVGGVVMLIAMAARRVRTAGGLRGRWR